MKQHIPVARILGRDQSTLKAQPFRSLICFHKLLVRSLNTGCVNLLCLLEQGELLHLAQGPPAAVSFKYLSVSLCTRIALCLGKHTYGDIDAYLQYSFSVCSLLFSTLICKFQLTSDPQTPIYVCSVLEIAELSRIPLPCPIV